MSARDPVTAAAPARCQRCAHLATFSAHGTARADCLRGRLLSGTCGWWRPRRASFQETLPPSAQS